MNLKMIHRCVAMCVRAPSPLVPVGSLTRLLGTGSAAQTDGLWHLPPGRVQPVHGEQSGSWAFRELTRLLFGTRAGPNASW